MEIGAWKTSCWCGLSPQRLGWRASMALRKWRLLKGTHETRGLSHSIFVGGCPPLVFFNQLQYQFCWTTLKSVFTSWSPILLVKLTLVVKPPCVFVGRTQSKQHVRISVLRIIFFLLAQFSMWLHLKIGCPNIYHLKNLYFFPYVPY